MSKAAFFDMSLEGIAKTLVLKGARCVSCHAPFTEKDINSYNHPNGIPIKGHVRRQWVYMTCQKCQYQSALWKILNDLQRR